MDALARACEEVASFNSRLRKIGALASYLRPLGDADLDRAVRFLCCGPIVVESGKKFSIGGATLRLAASAVTGWDAAILSLCYQDAGDTGETIGLLLHGRTSNTPLSLAEAEILYARLYKLRRTADRVALLAECFRTYRPGTLKFFAKIVTGNLRIGLQSRMVEEAIGLATGVPHDEIRHASNRVGNLPRIALAARHGTLAQMKAQLFHPMDFMLAKPLDRADTVVDPEAWLIEDKYDGIRSQAHIDDGRVRLFSRGMEEVSGAFPDVADALRCIEGSAVLDGEILAWRDERALAFTVLQQRLARKKVDATLIAGIPAVFIAYDLLYRDGAMLLETPLEARRALLEQIPVRISPQTEAATVEEIDTHFEQARLRGNEGLILKRRGSVYEPGRRSGIWQKLKRAYGTLDVVVTAAEQGHGRRATVLSDYTFAVRSGERFLNVGKAYSGLTDKEIRELTRIFRASATDRFGRVTLVRPEVVLEVAFDGVQKSPRHKSGYALRFPRILRWRQDKKPEESDSIERVAALYEASLVSGAIPSK